MFSPLTCSLHSHIISSLRRRRRELCNSVRCEDNVPLLCSCSLPGENRQILQVFQLNHFYCKSFTSKCMVIQRNVQYNDQSGLGFLCLSKKFLKVTLLLHLFISTKSNLYHKKGLHKRLYSYFYLIF